MPIPTDQQREYYVASLPIDTPQVPLVMWTGKIAILPNSDEYWCNGISWLPYGTNSSTVGSLDSTSPISGNPAALDTPGELAATIQAQAAQITALQAQNATLQSFKNANDTNNNNIVDTTDNIEVHAPDYVSLFQTGLQP